MTQSSNEPATAISENKGKGWAGAKEKWGDKSGIAGWTVLPALLFRYARSLGISPTQQALLFHLLSFWWFANSPPIVSKATLAERLGITQRQVQRHLQVLIKKGIIDVQFPKKPGRHPHEYSFSRLVAKIEKFVTAYARAKRDGTYQESRWIDKAGKN